MEYAKQMERVVNTFVAQVTELAKRAALESISSSMGIAVRSTFTAIGSMDSSRNRDRRGAGQMDATKAKLVRFIADNPGKRSEEINASLRTTTKDIALPLRQLVAEKRVKTEGARRGMCYFPGKKS